MTSLKQNVLVWVIFAVAMSMSAVAVWAAALRLLKALEFNWKLLPPAVFALLAVAVAAGLIKGVWSKRRWAVWPALALFFLFTPLIFFELFNSFVNPPAPADGFAENRGYILWEPLSEAEFWAREYKRRLLLVGCLCFVTLPVVSVNYLRQKGSLT